MTTPRELCRASTRQSSRKQSTQGTHGITVRSTSFQHPLETPRERVILLQDKVLCVTFHEFSYCFSQGTKRTATSTWGMSNNCEQQEYTHLHTHLHSHFYTLTHTSTHPHTHTPTRIFTHTLTLTHTHTHPHASSHTHSYTGTLTLTLTLTLTHSHTHTHLHTYTHTYTTSSIPTLTPARTNQCIQCRRQTGHY
jgi:hypothetical protein